MREYIVELVVKVDEKGSIDNFTTCLRFIEDSSRGEFEIGIGKVKEITKKEVGK